VRRRRTADNFVQSHLPRETVRQADNDHAEVQKVGDNRKQRHFLSAMLGSGRSEGTAYLADQRALHPQAAGLIQECRCLRRDAPESGRRADNNGVVIGKLGDHGNRRLLVQLEVSGLGDLLWHGFRNPLDVDRGARGARAFGDGFRHRFDMAIRGIVQNQNFGHSRPPSYICGDTAGGN